MKWCTSKRKFSFSRRNNVGKGTSLLQDTKFGLTVFFRKYLFWEKRPLQGGLLYSPIYFFFEDMADLKFSVLSISPNTFTHLYGYKSPQGRSRHIFWEKFRFSCLLKTIDQLRNRFTINQKKIVFSIIYPFFLPSRFLFSLLSLSVFSPKMWVRERENGGKKKNTII